MTVWKKDVIIAVYILNRTVQKEGTMMKSTKRKQTEVNIAFGITLIIAVTVAVLLIRRYAPSRTVFPLTDYYPTPEGEAVIVLQDTVLEQHGKFEDGMVYLKAEQVAEHLNQRFYWDSHENLLLYTTADSVIKAEPGKKYYRINKNKEETNYEVIKLDGEDIYIAIDFIKKYTDFAYQVYDEPKRVVITYRYGEELYFTKIKRKVSVRIKAGRKSDIVATVPKGSVLQCLDEEAQEINGFLHVITEDGVQGYISKRKAGEPYKATLVSENEYERTNYSHIQKDGNVSLVWHQVYNQDANAQLSSMLEGVKGVTAISPSWFRLTGTEGEMTSLASESYVKTAHDKGLEVWGMMTDVDEKIDMYELLSYTSKRERIEKQLLSQAIRYDLDGINLDLESITAEAAPSYLQFIRELSIGCRKNDIVLSIDSYVPTSYTAYYNRAEQAAVADYVVVMAYDEHYSGGGESGSVASIGYVQMAIENILKEVPAQQVLMGMPFYTRLWRETTSEDGSIEVKAESYGMKNSWKLVKDRELTPVWNEETAQYYVEYESDGAVCKIWLEDETSIQEKLKKIYKSELAGTAAWKLGLEKDEVWRVIQKYTSQ